MDGTAVQEIRDLGIKLAEPVVINNKSFTAVKMNQVEDNRYYVGTKMVYSLSSLAAYINKIEDDWHDKSFVHVVSETGVEFCSPFDDRGKRNVYVAAEFSPAHFGYGDQYNLEDFIIDLQACFVDTPAKASILKLIGNITDSASMQVEDDGVTQSVTTRKGISMQEQSEVPNPIFLEPYRTFPEVDQPESRFVFRLSSAHNREGMVASLHTVKDSLWKLEAMANIHKFLSEHVAVPII